MSSTGDPTIIPTRTVGWDQLILSERHSLAWKLSDDAGTNLEEKVTNGIRTSWAIVVRMVAGEELSFLHTGTNGQERIVIASRKKAVNRDILFCPHADRSAFLSSRVSRDDLGHCGLERAVQHKHRGSAVSRTFTDATNCRLHAAKKHPSPKLFFGNKDARQVQTLQQTNPAEPASSKLSDLTLDQRDALVRLGLQGNTPKIKVSSMMVEPLIQTKCVRLKSGTYHSPGATIRVDDSMLPNSEDRLLLYCPSASLRSTKKDENWARCPFTQAKACFVNAKDCREHISKYHLKPPRRWNDLNPNERHSLVFHLGAQTKVQDHVKDGVICSFKTTLQAGSVEFAHPPNSQTRIEAIIAKKTTVYFCKHAPPRAFQSDVSFHQMGKCHLDLPSNESPTFTLAHAAEKHGEADHSSKISQSAQGVKRALSQSANVPGARRPRHPPGSDAQRRGSPSGGTSGGPRSASTSSSNRSLYESPSPGPSAADLYASPPRALRGGRPLSTVPPPTGPLQRRPQSAPPTSTTLEQRGRLNSTGGPPTRARSVPAAPHAIELRGRVRFRAAPTASAGLALPPLRLGPKQPNILNPTSASRR